MNQELVVIIEESGLEKTQGQTILDNFSAFFAEASELEKKAKQIVVTDVSQVAEMASAREARLAIKSIRNNAENTRKSLKERSLREGKAIDGIANVIKSLTIPIEEYLEKQEKFAENLEIERQARLEEERINELSKYVEDISLYNFKTLSDEAFANLIVTVKASYEAQQAAIKKAEEDRIKAEEDYKIEQERIRKENEVLKAEAEKKEKALEKERDAKEKELEKMRAEAKAEVDAREKLEAEMRAKKEAEEEAKRVQEESERQAKLAPEKDKIFAYSERIKAIEAPQDLSKEGLKIVKDAESKLLAISQEIKLKLKNL